MKTRWIQLIAGFAMVVLCLMICTTTSDATVIWSDDFYDGNYDGWNICEDADLAAQLPGAGFNGSTWSATDGFLELVESPDPWGVISHPSNAAYGNWSFDFQDNDIQSRSGDAALVVFLSNDLYDWGVFSLDAKYYWIDFDLVTPENFTISLKKRSGSTLTTIDTTEVPAAGWHYIDVIRDITDGFFVYHNGALILQGEDSEFETSNQFWLWFQEGQIIDNIVVDTLVPPQIPWVLVAVGSGVAGAVILMAIVLLKRR